MVNRIKKRPQVAGASQDQRRITHSLVKGSVLIIASVLTHGGNVYCTDARNVPPMPPVWEGGYIIPSSTISRRDMAGAEAIHLEERTTAALDYSKRRAKADSEKSE